MAISEKELPRYGVTLNARNIRNAEAALMGGGIAQLEGKATDKKVKEKIGKVKASHKNFMDVKAKKTDEISKILLSDIEKVAHTNYSDAYGIILRHCNNPNKEKAKLAKAVLAKMGKVTAVFVGKFSDSLDNLSAIVKKMKDIPQETLELFGVDEYWAIVEEQDSIYCEKFVSNLDSKLETNGQVFKAKEKLVEDVKKFMNALQVCYDDGEETKVCGLVSEIFKAIATSRKQSESGSGKKKPGDTPTDDTPKE